jgi:membrane-bound lytic murein transglycosylase D
MQTITHISKYLLLLALSGLLLMVTSYQPMTEVLMVSSNSQQPTAKAADSIWAILSREFSLDHKIQSSQVQAEIKNLLADQGKLYSILKAAGPYIYFIHQQTRIRGLPAEIALIPVIESEFNPNDRSAKGAAGLWQLMVGTARELGVKVKAGYDGRRNVISSTRAALAYFKDLGIFFKGNWYLAIAAYNSGQGRVQTAERRAGSHNFWNLPLPKETKHYVPKLLAVAAIIENPQKYGVTLPPIMNQPYFTTIQIEKPVNLAEIAKSAKVNLNALHQLNPDYRQEKLAKKHSKNTILIPIQKTPLSKNN